MADKLLVPNCFDNQEAALNWTRAILGRLYSSIGVLAQVVGIDDRVYTGNANYTLDKIEQKIRFLQTRNLVLQERIDELEKRP